VVTPCVYFTPAMFILTIDDVYVYVHCLLLSHLDVDECDSPLDNKCEQLCENTFGGYVCSCKEGYNQDGHTTCTGKISMW